MNENAMSENHPWLRYFTICGIIMAALLVPMGGVLFVPVVMATSMVLGEIGLEVSGLEPLAPLLFIIPTLITIVPLLAGIYVLWSTKSYRKWESVGFHTKIIAGFVIAFGVVLGTLPLTIPLVILGALTPSWFWWLPWHLRY